MRHRIKPDLKNKEDETFELDLSPMLALMVCLIPIMLLSTEFVRVVIIESPLPQVVERAIAQDRDRSERPVLITLGMSEKGFDLKVEQAGRVIRSWNKERSGEGEWDLEGLNRELASIKSSYPQIFRLDLRPDPSVAYRDIVKVIDEARTPRDESLRFTVIDEATQETAETQLMFPDVLFGNLLEG